MIVKKLTAEIAELLTEVDDFSSEMSSVFPKWETQCCLLERWVELLPSKPDDHCKETDGISSKEKNWLKSE